MVSSVAAGRVAQKGDARKMLVMADLADLVELAGLNRRQETEILRRLNDVRTGAVRGIPWETVKAKMKKAR